MNWCRFFPRRRESSRARVRKIGWRYRQRIAIFSPATSLMGVSGSRDFWRSRRAELSATRNGVDSVVHRILLRRS